MTTATVSSSTTDTSQMAKLKRDKFALLAKVGHLGREVSALHEEADHYSSIATVLLAASMELLTLLEEQEVMEESPNERLVTPVSRIMNSIQKLLHFWPKGSMSQDRVYSMLDSDGLGMATVSSEDGFVYPSMDLILRNVERSIEASKARSPKQSSSYGMLSRFQLAGTSGNESLIRSLS